MSIKASNNPYPDSPDASPTKLDKGGYDGTAETLDNKINEILAEAKLLIDNTLVGSTSVGSIVPSSVPPATGAVHAFATQAGTYTNWGGFVVPANSFAFISRSSDLVFSISQTTLDVTGKVNVSDVVNTLVSTETTKPLSAAQGKALNEKIAKGIPNWVAGVYTTGDEVNHLGKDWVSNAAIISTDVPGASVKWDERLNKADLVVGKNKFDKSKALIGYFLNQFNSQSLNSSYDISDFVPVTLGQVFKSTHSMRSVTYFDINKNLVSGGSGDFTQNITIPTGVAFIRFSILHTDINVFQIENGTVSTTYEAYLKTVPASQLNLTDYTKKTDILDSLIPLLVNKADLVLGKNKFDKSKALIGYFLDQFNGQSLNSTYDISDFVPVTLGQVFKSTHSMRSVTYFDINKNLVSGGSGNSTQNITIPTGVAFIRFSIWHTDINVFQIENGTVSTDFEPYVITIPDLQIPSTVQRKTDAVTLIDGNVTEPKTTFFETSKNLFNPAEATLGYYVYSLNGVLLSNAVYNASGYIPVTAGQNYTMSYKHNIAWYNASKVYISGSENTDGVKTQLAPTGAVYLRCTIHTTAYGTFQVELGSTQTAYLPYGFSFKKKYVSKYFDELNLAKYDSLLGNDGKIVSQANLSLDSIIEVTDFPFHLKKGISMSIYADITTFGTISYGKGYGKYRGEYFTIDGTNVSQYYESALVIAKPHGLTINTFLKSSFSVDDNCLVNFILQSKTGYFKTTFQLGFEMNFEPFIRAGNQAITNVKLTVGSKDFQRPVWAFGDSYFGVGSARWPGTMKTFGYFNFLINGLAGQSSGGAYAELLRCLNYGTPRYILWCLGMNDSNENFISNFNSLKALCTDKSIKLILSTTPTVPTRDKELIKNTVLNSGYRYIDFYKAMGANSSGVWYPDYLNADGVHPNQIGADALALQVLIDFPELMQYGKNL